MGRKPDIALLVLKLLAECGCVSRRGFDMIPYSYVNTSINLKKLMEQEAVQLSGKGVDKHYTLLDSGWQMLVRENPLRYHAAIRPNRAILKRHPERSMRKGDVAAAFRLADYPVHPDDKPVLQAPSPPNRQNGQGAPAPERGYQDIAEYPGTPDKEIYWRHSRPYNCYYKSEEIKHCFAQVNTAGLGYSRACGAVISTDQMLRVYHCGDTAMELMQTGEDKLKLLLPRFFSGCSTADWEGILAFSSSFLAGEKILANSMGAYSMVHRLRRTAGKNTGTLLPTSNIGNPLYYLPLQKEAIALLRLIRYPDWLGWLRYRVVEELKRMEGDLRVLNPSPSLVVAVQDGFRCFLGIPMNLTAFFQLLHHMATSQATSTMILSMDWQQPFYQDAIEEYAPDCLEQVRWLTFRQDWLEDLEDDVWCHWV